MRFYEMSENDVIRTWGIERGLGCHKCDYGGTVTYLAGRCDVGVTLDVDGENAEDDLRDKIRNMMELGTPWLGHGIVEYFLWFLLF